MNGEKKGVLNSFTGVVFGDSDDEDDEEEEVEITQAVTSEEVEASVSLGATKPRRMHLSHHQGSSGLGALCLVSFLFLMIGVSLVVLLLTFASVVLLATRRATTMSEGMWMCVPTSPFVLVWLAFVVVVVGAVVAIYLRRARGSSLLPYYSRRRD